MTDTEGAEPGSQSSAARATLNPPGEQQGEGVRSTRGLELDNSDPDHALVRRFRLLVTRGPDSGTPFVSKGERTTIGTHESADFRLCDETVSRFHCEIEPTSSGVVIRDLGSRNGTRVDNISVLLAHIHPGAKLTLGRSELLFEPRSDLAKVAISPSTRFGGLVGASAPMRRVFALLEQAATNDATVLIEGETGTGKELTAESIHSESSRRDGPFVVVDCGAIPAELLESELFGHERGSFTGAVAAREGAFEAANGGTIFLDEIGELPLELQPKLLRALDKREIKRVGSSKYTQVNVRVVAATNRNLRKEVNEKRFRADVYYRLAVVRVSLPPLRERLEDIAALADSMLRAFKAQYGTSADFLNTPEFRAQLERHRWPGNVRELKNYLESCLALSTELSIPNESGPPSSERDILAALSDPNQPIKVARERWTRTFERRYLEEMLRRHDGNVARAARAAEVDRMHFYRLLWRHGLR